MLKITAGYIRVSTDDQIEYSPQSQIKALKEYAKSHDLILPDEFIFQDDGKSGRSTKKRYEFNRMIAMSKTKPVPFQTVLVWKFSRFARNQEESIFYKSMLKRNGVEVISISESVVEGPFGDLIERIIEWFDEYYSIRLSGEVKRGMKEKVSRGEAVSVPPFGYKLKNKALIIDDTEAFFVRKIFDDFANGKPYRALAVELNNQGVKSHRGNKFESRTVEYILNNPVYIGKIRWNPAGKTRRNYKDENVMLTDGVHKPIITEGQWNRAQEMIVKIKSMYKKNAKPCSCANILQGLMRCSNCGATLIKTGKYMQCCNYAKGMCSESHSTPYISVVNEVIEIIENDFKVGNFKINERKPEKDTHYEIICEQIKGEEKKLERVKFAYESGADTFEEYKNNKERIMKEIEFLKSKISALSYIPPENAAQKIIEKYQKSLSILHDENVPTSEKNNLLRSFIDKIIYDKRSQNLDFYYYL